MNFNAMENKRDLRKLADTALGKHPADLVVKDGVLMDVYTGRMLPVGSSRRARSRRSQLLWRSRLFGKGSSSLKSS